MTRVLFAAVAGLLLLLILAVWRGDRLSTDLEQANLAITQSEARVTSLRSTLRLQRELAADQGAIEANYLTEVKDAQDEAERLRTCLADGTCGLRIAATCPSVRVDRATAVAGEPDAGAPRLTAAAERAYTALAAGIETQRAQVKALQEQLITLHSKCRIGG